MGGQWLLGNVGRKECGFVIFSSSLYIQVFFGSQDRTGIDVDVP